MAKKSKRRIKVKDEVKKKDASSSVTSDMTPLHFLAPFCLLSVFMPWILEALGVYVPRGVEKASTWVGLFCLGILLVLVLKRFLGR